MPSDTHNHLVQKAERWLRSQGCGVVFSELVAATHNGESPDAIGWREGYVSMLVECKASRSDFLRDRGKIFRINGNGMGDWRFYLCPPGVIEVEDLPEGWGLLHLHGNSILKVYGVPPNTAWASPNHMPFSGNKTCEMVMMYSALRRAQAKGRAA